MDVLMRRNGARCEEAKESITVNFALRAMRPASRDTIQKQGVCYCLSRIEGYKPRIARMEQQAKGKLTA